MTKSVICHTTNLTWYPVRIAPKKSLKVLVMQNTEVSSILQAYYDSKSRSFIDSESIDITESVKYWCSKTPSLVLMEKK
jgi:hypothetical protein